MRLKVTGYFIAAVIVNFAVAQVPFENPVQFQSLGDLMSKLHRRSTRSVVANDITEEEKALLRSHHDALKDVERVHPEVNVTKDPSPFPQDVPPAMEISKNVTSNATLVADGGAVASLPPMGLSLAGEESNAANQVNGTKNAKLIASSNNATIMVSNDSVQLETNESVVASSSEAGSRDQLGLGNLTTKVDREAMSKEPDLVVGRNVSGQGEILGHPDLKNPDSISNQSSSVNESDREIMNEDHDILLVEVGEHNISGQVEAKEDHLDHSHLENSAVTINQSLSLNETHHQALSEEHRLLLVEVGEHNISGLVEVNSALTVDPSLPTNKTHHQALNEEHNVLLVEDGGHNDSGLGEVKQAQTLNGTITVTLLSGGNEVVSFPDVSSPDDLAAGANASEHILGPATLSEVADLDQVLVEVPEEKLDGSTTIPTSEVKDLFDPKSHLDVVHEHEAKVHGNHDLLGTVADEVVHFLDGGHGSPETVPVVNEVTPASVEVDEKTGKASNDSRFSMEILIDSGSSGELHTILDDRTVNKSTVINLVNSGMTLDTLFVDSGSGMLTTEVPMSDESRTISVSNVFDLTDSVTLATVTDDVVTVRPSTTPGSTSMFGSSLLFPPALPNPAAIFGQVVTGIAGVQAAVVKMVTSPFQSVTGQNRMTESRGLDVALATPFIMFGSKHGMPLVVVSSVMAVPMVYAGGFFTIPFISSGGKDTVPFFVVTDSINSFSMEINAPELKPAIESGQLIVVARTPETEKLLEPLLQALKGVDRGVKDQTIILQPVHKASTSSSDVPSAEDLASAVQEVRRVLGVDTFATKVTNMVDKVRTTVVDAGRSVSKKWNNFFGTGSERDEQSLWVPVEDWLPDSWHDEVVPLHSGEVPVVWEGEARTAADRLVTRSSGEVYPSSPTRGRRDTSEMENELKTVPVEWNKPPANHFPANECRAVLTDISTNECKRLEVYAVKSCFGHLNDCKRNAQDDLMKLLGFCQNPMPDLTCSFASTVAKDMNEFCSVYTFKITRILSHDQSCRTSKSGND